VRRKLHWAIRVAGQGRLAARAMHQGLEMLKPELVMMMGQAAGIEDVDQGIDVPGDKFILVPKGSPGAKAVGMSMLLSATMKGRRRLFISPGQRRPVPSAAAGSCPRPRC
jgi:hypothetical protein